ncbi:efflux RND transporter periplasmic adaptor subunit [candidate division KSB1 bacterium]|nr:efflux RND transporter periplasmic adaptor subunit [candidate division KSB1 bacterium]
MKRRTVVISAGLLTSVILVFLLHCRGKNDVSRSWNTAEVKRGDLVTIVSCSGTLEAVGTVEVGTQVSGVLDRLTVDFNDPVRKNQVLAVLDTVMLKASILEAEANFEKAQAQLQEATITERLKKQLHEKGFLSEADYLPFRINLKIAQASLKSTRAALMRADRNLKYAVIRSPIDGTVIQRSVEEGQTVAASLQAPTLFVIAEDLSSMEIHAQVDESDIGAISEGQRAEFEVAAWPDRIFHGIVRQVRLQPEVIQNVVNYTVIVDARNDEGTLLPGMTATIDFYVEEKKDILLVPNSALRFQPGEDLIVEMRERMRRRAEPGSDSSRAARSFRMDSGGVFRQKENSGRVWYLNAEGQPEVARLQLGASDGQFTQVVASGRLQEGMQVILGYQEGMAPTRVRNTNPLSGGRPPGRAPF